MLNHPYLKYIGLGLVIPLFIPFLSKILVYIDLLNRFTYDYINFFITYINASSSIQLPAIITKTLSLMFWPFFISIVIDLFYRYVLKKTFEYHIICAILLWVFFNCGSFLA